ncbi:MAG: hypothetical protein KGJ94_06070 [Xanthomonadaceae bacterium]|nr:hypothetical protein [Xanthomonadaceae bacterium]
MNAQKPIAVIVAMLITAAGMAGIVNYTNAAASSLERGGINATTQVIRTLPAVDVHPSREQMRQLRDEQAGSVPANLRMPFYSFASDSTGA